MHLTAHSGNRILHGSTYSGSQREAQTELGGITLIRSIAAHFRKFDILALQHAHNLFKGKHVVDGFAVLACFHLFGNAGTDEHGNGIRIFFLYQLSAGEHGGGSVGNFIRSLRHLCFNQLNEGRAAGAGHKALLGRNLIQIFLCFFNAGDIGADSNLYDFSEACFLKCLVNLRHSNLQTVLAYDRRCHKGDNLLALLDFTDNADDIAALVDSTEGAGVAAGTAGNTFFVVNYSLTVFTDADGTDGAGTHAGTMDFDNRTVGAHLLAASAFDTFRFIDKGTVLNNADSLFRAVIHAFVGDAVTAHIGNVISINRALVAGCGEHVDNRQIGALRLVQRQLGSLDDIAGALLPQRHINTVFQYGSFFINTAAVARSILAYLLQNIVDVVRQLVIPGVAG